MIPIQDRTLRGGIPFVNILLILANLLVFYVEWQAPGEQLERLIFTYGFVPQRFFENVGLSADVLPLFSSMYLHGGWFHLLSNMLSLWIFGDNVEDRIGHINYFLFYTVAGVVATMTQGIVEPTSTIPIVGASGAIAGVMGAYLLFFPRASIVVVIPIFIFFTVREIPALLFIVFWFVLQLFNGVMALNPMAAQAGIAWWAHIGGFVIGFLLALFVGRTNS